MPTTYDMTGLTHSGILKCLRWLYNDRNANGNGHGRAISVVLGSGTHVQAWGDELEIRDAETNRPRLPRWWEHKQHGEKQRLFPWQAFRPLKVAHTYQSSGEYDIELQQHPNRRMSRAVLVFGDARRADRLRIRAIRIHNVPPAVADGAGPNTQTSRTAVNNRLDLEVTGAISGRFQGTLRETGSSLSDWSGQVDSAAQSLVDFSATYPPTSRDAADIPVQGDESSRPRRRRRSQPEPEAVRPGPPLNSTPESQIGPLVYDDAVPHTSVPNSYDPPVTIDRMTSVEAWIEQTTREQREGFASVNGNFEDVRQFFARLGEETLSNGGWAESSDRCVYSRRTNELIGYNLTIDDRNTYTGGNRVSIDLIDGSRWVFITRDLSQISSPGYISSQPEQPRNQYRGDYSASVGQDRPTTSGDTMRQAQDRVARRIESQMMEDLGRYADTLGAGRMDMNGNRREG